MINGVSVDAPFLSISSDLDETITYVTKTDAYIT